MSSAGKHVDDYSDSDQRRTEPCRPALGWYCRCVLHELQLLQEESKTCYDESESHQSQTGANPGKKSPFGSKVIAYAGSF